jgi:hypothetical protein
MIKNNALKHQHESLIFLKPIQFDDVRRSLIVLFFMSQRKSIKILCFEQS